jgi:hypothetical protein
MWFLAACNLYPAERLFSVPNNKAPCPNGLNSFCLEFGVFC